ncbi:hypothetical protein [Streptomyces sp. NPDC060002]|uniref:hypothetical protein n=1 Tax=Streptomyces sp. NPDC060002 TaxID=3347033 RepID=UPI0036738CCC
MRWHLDARTVILAWSPPTPGPVCLDAPFPVTGYRSTLTVHEVPCEPETSRVEWSRGFTPAGVGDEEAVALFHGIDADGLDALLRMVTDA